MKIQTLSVLVGSTACNARCPYCVSRMTPRCGMKLGLADVNWRNFNIGCRLAKENGVSTALLTGKGEPTLYPDRIGAFLYQLYRFGFPLVELQTNGIALFQDIKKHEEYLKEWHGSGLTTIAISITHYDNLRNKNNFQPKGNYMDLAGLISYLHQFGFSVRLSCVMFKGGIDCIEEIKNLVNFAKENKAEQLTITPVRAPGQSTNQKVKKWVGDHQLSVDGQVRIKCFLAVEGKKLLPLAHGAVVYDLYGQNICLSDCLTENTSPEEIRQLIFFPDGHLRYDWQYEGAILL